MKIARSTIGAAPDLVRTTQEPKGASRVESPTQEPRDEKLAQWLAGPATRTDAPPVIGRFSKPTKMTSTHIKSRTEKPAIYPDRFLVPDEKVSWSMPFKEYKPADFVAPVVLANADPKTGWADPPDVKSVQRKFESYTGPVQTDERGRPLNPMGRTGVEGRGLLGRWGANFAADPIVTRRNPETQELEMLAIRRKDNGQWAIPGGMVDRGEEISATLSREFEEETGVKLSMGDAAPIFRGYADDPRNTDNAWMETTVKHKHLSPEQALKMEPKAGDDAAAVQWMQLSEANVSQLYGNHAGFVRLALERLSEGSG